MAWTDELAYEKTRRSAPVTLPTIKLPDLDTEREAAEAAERATITRTIRQGRDCWEQIGNANSFSAWCKIGAALAVGKAYALRTSKANCAWGAAYSKTFNRWMAEYGFGAMRPSDRSYAVALHENLEAIERWRASLPDKQRRRLRGAQQSQAMAEGNATSRRAVPRWRCNSVSRMAVLCFPGEGVAA